jgi:hypothetical protein
MRTRGVIVMRYVFLLVLGVVCVAAPAAAQNGPSKCTAAKTKASGAYVLALANCQAKAIAKGVTVDPLCEAKALSKLQKAFSNAEKKEDCLERGEVDFVQKQGEDFRKSTATVVEAEPICCAIGLSCLYVTTEFDCVSGYDGTVGFAGSVCTGDGSCGVAPATGGSCCEVDLGNGCAVGATEDGCEMGGGNFVPGGRCEPTGHCIIPK